MYTINHRDVSISDVSIVYVFAKLNDVRTTIQSLAVAYDVVLVCRCIPFFLHPNLCNAFSDM